LPKVNSACPSGLFVSRRGAILAVFFDPGKVEGRLRLAGGGKSELRRARCRVTRSLSVGYTRETALQGVADGQCNRKQTARFAG
jgi:hypothetical protein